VHEAVVNVLTNLDEDIDVRRRALEAISNSSLEIVDEAIQEAYSGDERRMQVSAVFAMGRSCDPQWSDFVLRELTSDDPEMRYEAARAAGELEIAEAVPHLTRLGLDSDREIQDMAIWSLGEIGGREALRILNAMAQDAEQNGDRDLREAIDDAIATANLASGSLTLLDFDQDDR
jgi:HEAT repeat protein